MLIRIIKLSIEGKVVITGGKRTLRHHLRRAVLAAGGKELEVSEETETPRSRR